MKTLRYNEKHSKHFHQIKQRCHAVKDYLCGSCFLCFAQANKSKWLLLSEKTNLDTSKCCTEKPLRLGEDDEADTSPVCV